MDKASLEKTGSLCLYFSNFWEIIMIIDVMNSVSDEVFVLMVLLLASIVFSDPVKLKSVS